MNEIYGEKSFNPMEFSIYYSGIDFASVNVWDLFRRKLPGQIALICFTKPKAISEISIETGCSSCYIEEEIDILIKAGVINEVVKGKYQTNFHILRKEELDKIDEMFDKMYKNYTNEVIKEFEDNFEKIKKTNIYNYDATIDQYKWIFADRVADMDRRNMFTSDPDYPRILSCGARGLVFGMEAPFPKSGCGQSPTYLEQYTLWARDFLEIQGCSYNQPILRNKDVAQTVIDVYNGIIDDKKEQIYADLIKYNVLIKQDGKLCSKVAYLNKEFETLIKEINNRLYVKLEKDTREIREYLEKVVYKNIPNSLKEYAHGYVITWMEFFAGNKIIDALLKNGFLVINDHPQISYFINKKKIYYLIPS